MELRTLHQHMLEEAMEEEFLVVEETREEEFRLDIEVDMGPRHQHVVEEVDMRALHQHVVEQAMDGVLPREAACGDRTMIREIKNNLTTTWDLPYTNGCSNHRRRTTIVSQNSRQHKLV